MKFLKKFKQRKKQKSPRVRLLSQKKANRLVLIVGVLFWIVIDWCYSSKCDGRQRDPPQSTIRNNK